MPHPNLDPNRIDQLPRTSGVYLFYGEGSLPLYIGKSIDIRTRVMSHFRAVDEARMMGQTQRIEVIETAGEIGALLLESHLVKTMSPLYNQRLRRLRSLCSLQLNQTDLGLMPELTDSKATDFATTQDLYGVFASRHAALDKLNTLAQSHQLCRGILGLEKIGSRGCFGVQIRSCLGACIGQEDRAAHDQRLKAALETHQLTVWPYEGAVDLIEQQDDWIQRHRIHRWAYLGTDCSRSGEMSRLSDRAARLDRAKSQAPEFDLDSYKILVKPIMLGAVRVEPVQGS